MQAEELSDVSAVADYDGRILLLGRSPVVANKFAKHPDRWQPSGDTRVYTAPSVKEVLGTAGGLTKLGYAVNLYLTGVPYQEDYSAPYTRVTGTTTDVPRPPAGAELVVDIEVSGNIDTDEPDDTDLLAVSVLWEHNGEPRIVVFDRDALGTPALVSKLRNTLRHAPGLIGHNGKFDFRWINRILGINVYPTDDTMLMHHSMFHGAGEHGLKALAQRIFGAPEWEADLGQYVRGKGHFEKIPADVLCRYNAQDVFWTWMLLHRLRKMLVDRPWAQDAYALEMEAARMFQDIEAFGMPLDLDYAHYLDDYFTDRYGRALPFFHQVAGEEINPNSHVQIKRWFAARQIKLATTDKDTLTALVRADRHVDFIQALITCRQIKKAHSTYVIGPLKKVRPNGFVHPVFKIHGTSTGRLSCSNPNVQNVPNDSDTAEGMPSLRRMYSAPPGWVFVGCDYSQAELRVIAELAADEQMLFDLRDGAPDFFDNLMPSVWPEIDFRTLDKQHRKPYRLKCKRIVYGLNYGRTAWAIAIALTLEGTPTSEEEAQTIADRYLGRYPGLQRWRADTMANVAAGNWITPFGREYQQDVITEWGKRRAENQAWAFFPQSVASDICLTAAIDLHKKFKKNAWQGSIVATVHDAVYALVPVDLADTVMAEMKLSMTGSAQKLYSGVPFPVDGHIAQHWNYA